MLHPHVKVVPMQCVSVCVLIMKARESTVVGRLSLLSFCGVFIIWFDSG